MQGGKSTDVDRLMGDDVDLEMLTEGDKEAIALKFLGENDVDCMYGELHSHLKRIQKEHKVEFVGIKGSTTKETMLDTIVAWALSMQKVCVKQMKGSRVTQDVVVLS